MNLAGPVQHARDIPDATFLAAIRTAAQARHDTTATIDDLTSTLAGDWQRLRRLRQYADGLGPWPEPERYEDVPVKVVRAKAKRLIARNVIEGCACGCSGFFRVLPSAA